THLTTGKRTSCEPRRTASRTCRYARSMLPSRSRVRTSIWTAETSIALQHLSQRSVLPAQGVSHSRVDRPAQAKVKPLGQRGILARCLSVPAVCHLDDVGEGRVGQRVS